MQIRGGSGRLARRGLRLALFFILTCLAAYLAVNIIPAWLYIYFLTHPGCRQPSPIANTLPPQEHWITTLDGLSLRVWYYPAQNGAAIITLGGMRGALGETLPPVDFLVEEGFGVLQIDSRLCARPPAVVTLGAKEAGDAEQAFLFLQSLSEVEKIGIFGFSMGAAAAIRAAARRPEIAAVVAEGGYFNLGDDFIDADRPASPPRRFFLFTVAGAYWLQSGVDPWQVSPIADLPAISPRPILLIYGEKEVASGRAKTQFDAAGEPKILWIVPGGAHGTNYAVSPGEYRRRITEFFTSTLLP